MPKPALAVHRTSLPIPWQAWAALAVFAAFSWATLALAIACLWIHAGAPQTESTLAPAGIVCIACFLVQSRIATAAWRNRRHANHEFPWRQLHFWVGLSAGAFFAYLAALALGPRPYIGWAWLSAVAVAYTCLLLPLAASPRALEGWRKWTQGRTPRRLSWLVYLSILIVFCAEGSLRVHRFVGQRGWLAHESPSPTTGPWGVPTCAGVGRRVGETEVVPSRSGPFRVVILGDDAALGGSLGGGYLARVQQMSPGLEIVPLRLDSGWSSVPSDDVPARLAACRPDLALGVISVAELTRRPAVSSWFDWRQFALAEWALGANRPVERPADEALPSSSAALDDFESFLGVLAPQLAACRTPIDPAMRDRWQQTFASLDRLVGGCRAAHVPFALLLVPCEFQVNGTLCDTLLRRNGCAFEQFDVELPQRRLASFADHRQVPLLDLLPHLRLARQSLYQRNATTWNDSGHSAAASAIGPWLKSQYSGEPALAARVSRAP